MQKYALPIDYASDEIGSNQSGFLTVNLYLSKFKIIFQYILTKAVLEQVQKLLNLLNIDSKPDNIFQLNSAFFIKILETICFDKMKNTIKIASCLDDEIFNYNLVLSALQSDILGENIDHISAECLVRFDSRNIRNLVEIFSCLGELVICEVGSNAFPPTKFDFKGI